MITNLSRKTMLAKKFDLCVTDWSKAIGLMFSPGPRAIIMVFNAPVRPNLHMLFVFFPIDVLCLDAMKRVVAVKEDFKPWTFWKNGALCNYIIELPAGTVRRTQTRIADLMQF